MASAQIYLLDSIENLGISGIQGHLGKVKAGVAMGLLLSTISFFFNR